MRILATHLSQPGEAVGAGHVEVQQHKIPVGSFGQTLLQLADAAYLAQADGLAQPIAKGLTQRTAKQGVIIGNQDVIGETHARRPSSHFCYWLRQAR